MSGGRQELSDRRQRLLFYYKPKLYLPQEQPGSRAAKPSTKKTSYYAVVAALSPYEPQSFLRVLSTQTAREFVARSQQLLRMSVGGRPLSNDFNYCKDLTIVLSYISDI